MLTLKQRQERAARRAARIAAKHEAIRQAACQDKEGSTIMKKNTKAAGTTKAPTKPTAAPGATEKPPATKDAKKAKAAKGAKPAAPALAEKKTKKPSLLNLAAGVLAKAGKPMGCKEIVEAILAGGEWKTKGKTPAATLYSAIIREIANPARGSRFKKVERGQFAATGTKVA
jgi:hypothetical protein